MATSLLRCSWGGCAQQFVNPDEFRAHGITHLDKRLAKWRKGQLKVKKTILSALPVETWLEAVSFIRRKELKRIDDSAMSRFFHSVAHIRLHDQWSPNSRRLPLLTYELDGRLTPDFYTILPIPRVPIPQYFGGFYNITLERFDAGIFTFLNQIKRLLFDVHLECTDNSTDPYYSSSPALVLKMLKRVLSLCTSLQALTLNHPHNLIPLFRTHFADRFYSIPLLAIPIREDFLAHIQQDIIQWLKTSVQGRQKKLVLYQDTCYGRVKIAAIHKFITAIKQDFVDANQIASFVALFLFEEYKEDKFLDLELFELQNELTGERLILKLNEIKDHFVLNRCPKDKSAETSCLAERELLEVKAKSSGHHLHLAVRKCDMGGIDEEQD